MVAELKGWEMQMASKMQRVIQLVQDLGKQSDQGTKLFWEMQDVEEKHLAKACQEIHWERLAHLHFLKDLVVAQRKNKDEAMLEGMRQQMEDVMLMVKEMEMNEERLVVWVRQKEMETNKGRVKQKCLESRSQHLETIPMAEETQSIPVQKIEVIFLIVEVMNYLTLLLENW